MLAETRPDTALEIVSSLVRSVQQATSHDAPFHHWTLTDCLPDFATNAVIGRMGRSTKPVDLNGVSGKRELHNDQRIYFNPEMRKQFMVADDIAMAFQSPTVTAWIEATFGTYLGNTHLRIEYAQDVDGFHLEPHTDLGVKVFTMLIYLSGTSDMGTDLFDADRKHAGRSPFKCGGALVFVPGTDTWHGFVRRPIEGIRRSLIVNYVKPAWKSRDQLSFLEPIETWHDTVEATTRQARTVLLMSGDEIAAAREWPVLHRGQWVKVIA